MQHFSHHYQSDISRQQFDLIRQDLEASRKRTHPKHIDPYDIFCKGSIRKIQTRDSPNRRLILRVLIALLRTLFRTAPQSSILHVRDQFEKSKPGIQIADRYCC
uniref:hypothetical protein n=1 Tax=Lentilactobacillus hilgardii TaxID=1588 RepID=UPI00403F06CE